MSYHDRLLPWPDGAERTVPLRHYEVASNTTPRAWIIFSVGFGGNKDGYAYLARAWARAGFEVIVVEHIGSNLEVLRSLPQTDRKARNREVVKRVASPGELSARPQDLRLVYEHFESEFTGLPLALAGHSYGSYSILAACGLQSHIEPHQAESIPADCLLAISPQPPGMLFAQDEYTKVGVPTLVLTGTKDHLLSGESTYLDRLEVARALPTDLSYTAVLEGVEHMAFAAIGLGIKKQLDCIEKLTNFWWEQSLVAEPSSNWELELREHMELYPEMLHQVEGASL